MNDTDKQLTKEDILKHRADLYETAEKELSNSEEVQMLGRFAHTFGD
jgi:hypothetical protein